MNKKVSCIIPAYNEENRIFSVLSAVQNHPLLKEVIVVNDGSKDKTSSVVKKFKKVKLIDLKQNKGKSHALMVGIKAARSDTLIFLDADLQGLNRKNITDLIDPVITGKADVSMSLRKNSLLIYKIIKLDHVSGERVLDKKMLGDIGYFQTLPGYGIESYVNKIIIEKKLRIKVVNWKNVRCMPKAEKIGFIRGWIGEFNMIRQIARTVGYMGIIRQIYDMLKLKV